MASTTDEMNVGYRSTESTDYLCQAFLMFLEDIIFELELIITIIRFSTVWFIGRRRMTLAGQ